MKNPAILALPFILLSACGSESVTNTTTPANDETTPIVANDNQHSPTFQPDSQQTETGQPTDDNTVTPETETEETEETETETETENTSTETEQETTPPVPPQPEDNQAAVGDCAAPPAGTTIVSQSAPVHENDNPWYYPVMGPQCVATDNQFDGPGLAFGDFLLINNAWNATASNFDWQQCIALTASNGTIVPSWNYDWGNEDDLQDGLFEWEVKSYPELIYGYKSNEEISAPCSATGLPATVAGLPEISIAYSYRAPVTDKRVGDKGDEANNPIPVTGGDRNVAIESFFHSSCDIRRGDNSNMELELMVWLEMGNERLPSGQPPVARYTGEDGQVYNVYTKSDNYVAYVAQNPTTAGTLNWTEFVNDARANATTYGVKYLENNWCMANVIFGSEIWWGEGSVVLDQYEITSKF